MAAPVLRYFDCRSRGQAIRFVFAWHDIAFEDLRVPVESLGELRDRVRDGREPELPFGTLPWLRWDDVALGETLAIAGYLEARLGPTRTPAERARLDMVCSATHLDMQAPYRELFWKPDTHPEPALRAVARGLLDHLLRRLQQLESLAGDTPFFGGASPAVADLFVYESIDRARTVFGDAFEQTLRRTPQMLALADAIDAHAHIAACHREARVPYPVTASPSERALRERLPELLEESRE